MGYSLAGLDCRAKEERAGMGLVATSATKAATYTKGLIHFVRSRAAWRWQWEVWDRDEHILLADAGSRAIPPRLPIEKRQSLCTFHSAKEGLSQVQTARLWGE